MVNNLMSVWSTIFGVVLALLILLAMITIHEFGHYVAGKLLKFKINEFAIGFGPALFKRKRKNSDEVFSIRLLPLGGYCSFEGEDGLEEKSKDKTEGKASMPAEEPFAEVTETSAVEVEKKPDAPMAEASERQSDAPAEEVSKEPEGTPEAPPVKLSDGAFTKKKPWQRIIVLVAGATMNYLLALLLIIVCFFSYGQTMLAVYEAEPATDEYIGYSLEDKDILLQVEGKNLYLTLDIAKALNGKKQGELVEFRVSRIVGHNEDGTNIREEMDVEVMLRSDVKVKNSTDFTSVWDAIGVRYQEKTEDQAGGYMLANAVYRFGFFETIGRSFVYSFKIAGSIFRVLGELLTGKLGLSAFGGPVTTIKLTSQIAGTSFRNFLEISAYIGVNLAVFNLLPIPALDGSKVVFTVIEWIFKKPVNRKVEAIIHTVGFVLLLVFAILVDVLQFIL